MAGKNISDNEFFSNVFGFSRNEICVHVWSPLVCRCSGGWGGGGGVGSWNVVIGGDSFLMGCGDNFEKLLYTFIHLTLCSIKHSTENTINKIVAKANVIIAYLFQLRTVSIRETRNVRKFTKRRKKNFVHIRLRIIYEIV